MDMVADQSIYFITELQSANPASYTLLTKDLDQEQQTYIMSIMSTAEQHRVAAA